MSNQRITVVPADSCVIVEGDALAGLALPVSTNVHAIQWHGTHGIIERTTGGAEYFTDFSVVAPFLDVWQAKRDELDNPPPPPVPTLAEVKASAEYVIDAAASVARARFISSGVGQDGVYVVKGQQAEAYAAAGFSGPVPSYVAKEAEVLGITARAAAEIMLAVRDAWNTQVGPNIEGLRIGGKKRVRDASTVQEVTAEVQATTQALQAIQP